MSKANRDVNDDPSKTWKTEFDEDAHVVVSTIWGQMNDKELMAAAADRIKLGNEKGTTEFILDCSGFVANDRSTFESVYEIVTRSYPEMNVSSDARIAFVPPVDEGSSWFVGFFVRMCESRGWTLHEVPDHDAAYAWLKNPPEDSAD